MWSRCSVGGLHSGYRAGLEVEDHQATVTASHLARPLCLVWNDRGTARLGEDLRKAGKDRSPPRPHSMGVQGHWPLPKLLRVRDTPLTRAVPGRQTTKEVNLWELGLKHPGSRGRRVHFPSPLLCSPTGLWIGPAKTITERKPTGVD